MTFNKAAWAIDGAQINSALARSEAYAAASGSEGVVQRAGLKVSPLDTPGNGVQISAGSALILNRYQGANIDQVYTVSNPGIHTVPSVEMPASNASAKSYILAVVVGDPEFSQVGHPFMLSSDPPDGEEATFNYVRPKLIPVASSSVTTLSVGYPALPLARIDIPANTTTITAGMITDLRRLARPRSRLEMAVVNGNSTTLSTLYTAPTWQRFPNVPILQVEVPSWATTAKVLATVEGVRLTATARSILRPYIEGTSKVGSQTNAYEDATLTSGVARRAYTVGGVFDVSDLAGSVRTFSVHAGAYTSGDANKFLTDTASSVLMQVYFEEAPI